MKSQNTPQDIIEQLFARRQMYERLARLYVDAETARDIMMDSFRYVWENRERIDPGQNPALYMTEVVRSKCLDHLRREATRRRAQSQIQTDAEWDLNMRVATLEAFDPHWLFDTEIRDRVRLAIQRLPERTRRIFTMSRREGIHNATIAASEGITVKAVEYHISRALRQLRADLGDYIPVLLALIIMI